MNKHIIAVPPTFKALRIERHSDHWRIWTQANATYTLGDFVSLYDNGKITKTVIRRDEGDDVILIREGDR